MEESMAMSIHAMFSFPGEECRRFGRVMEVENMLSCPLWPGQTIHFPSGRKEGEK